MKLFFRKHGNSLFYIVLPLFFLVLTVSLIQFSPKISRSDLGDSCLTADDCVTNSSLCVNAGDFACDNAGDPTSEGTCVFARDNRPLVCADGSDPAQGPIPGNNCACVCADGSLCQPCCNDNEDPATDGCIDDPDICPDIEGSGPCSSLYQGPVSPGRIVFLFLGLGIGLVAWFAVRRRTQS